jgi:anti-sigma regulatory factor (Ser/Thr protein kinase)
MITPFSFIYAQDCGCPSADLNRLEQLRDNNDTIAAYALIKDLKADANKNCRVYGYTLDILFLITGKKLDSVLEVVQEQEKIANNLPCKQVLSDHVYLNYSRYYKRQNDYENMSAFAFKSLASAELNKNRENELRAIKDVVHVFTRQDQDDKIPEYVKRAEKIIAGLPENYISASNYNWLAFEYETWYTRIQRNTLLDTALLYAGKAISAAKATGNLEQITQSFRVHEAVAYHRGDLRKAVAAMDSALFYAKQIKILTTLGGLYIAKAMDHLDLGEKAEAMKWADTSIWYVDRDFKGTPSALGVYKQAAELYELAGNLPKSYTVFKSYEKMKDSLFKVQRAEKINELEQKYNKARNEKTIKELAQQKRIYILLAAAGLFALVGLVFFIRHQSQKNKQKILETEQRLNRARMNPHFFFNALSSLQSYALEGNDGKSIASNLSKFSHIMRETLESTYKEYVTIEQESDFLREYLELQKIRFPQKFVYAINIASSVEPDDTLIPAMILQPFAENSIEHGFTGINYPGELSITFDKKEKDLLISIVDNGKGLANSPKEASEHISRASQIIKDRIYLLNIKLKTNASFSIANNQNGKGVTVLVKLPLLFKQDYKA